MAGKQLTPLPRQQHQVLSRGAFFASAVEANALCELAGIPPLDTSLLATWAYHESAWYPDAIGMTTPVPTLGLLQLTEHEYETHRPPGADPDPAGVFEPVDNLATGIAMAGGWRR